MPAAGAGRIAEGGAGVNWAGAEAGLGGDQVQLSYEDLEQHLCRLQRFTAVKGRREAHLWALLLYATPPWFKFDGELVEGWGKGAFYGDTTTAKGQTIKGIRKCH